MRIKKFYILVNFLFLLAAFGSRAEYFPVSPDVGDWQYWRYTALCPDFFGEQGPFSDFQSAYNLAISNNSIILFEGWTGYHNCGTNFPKVGFGILKANAYRIELQAQGNPDPTDVDGVNFVVKRRTVSCPSGTQLTNDRFCLFSSPDPINNGQSCASTGNYSAGNPIHIGTGNKYQREVDFRSTIPNSLLSLERSYNSSNRIRGAFGGRWTSIIDVQVTHFNSATFNSIWVLLEDGKLLTFNGNNGDWISVPQTGYQLAENTEGYELTKGVKTYQFDTEGKIVSIKDPNRDSLSFIYTNGVISRVESSSGEFIEFSHGDEGEGIASATLSNGETLRYIYDTTGGTPGHGNLVQVEHDYNAEITTRHYHYEDSAFPQALTGITDETGVRYVTWTYDSSGQAVSSEHALGADHTALDFSSVNDPNDPRVTVTNPLGKQTTYHYQDIEGALKVVQVEGHQSANCAAANKSYTYYPNGLVESKTDWQGNRTRYFYNSRGLEERRIEAEGALYEREIETLWHPNLSLITKVIEKGKETNYFYTIEGKLQSTQVVSMPVPTN